MANVSVEAPSGGGSSMNDAGTIGTRFVLFRSADVAAPLGTRTRVDTNTATCGSFSFPPGPDAMAFCGLQSD